MHFTLAGPDIGVRKLDIAGLMSLLGEDLGMWAASAANEDAPIEVPNQEPPRVVRVWKPGDESMDYNYYRKRVRQPIVAAPVTEPTTEVANTDSNAVVKRDFDEPILPDTPIQTMAEQAANGQLALYEAEFDLTIRVGRRSIYVVGPAGKPELAKETLRRLATDQQLPAGMGVMFDPNIEASIAITRLQRAGTLRGAGWEITPGEAAEHPQEFARRFIHRMVAEEIRAFNMEVGDNADRLVSALRRRF